VAAWLAKIMKAAGAGVIGGIMAAKNQRHGVAAKKRQQNWNGAQQSMAQYRENCRKALGGAAAAWHQPSAAAK